MADKQQPARKRKFSMESHLQGLPDEKVADIRKNLQLLREYAQAKHSIEVRDDSYLAYVYAASRAGACKGASALGGDESETATTAGEDPDCGVDAVLCVCEEMACTQKLYEMSQDLQDSIEHTMRRVAALLRNEFPHVPWGIIWKNVRLYVHPLLKSRVSLDRTADR
jgi:hypothetical protein